MAALVAAALLAALVSAAASPPQAVAVPDRGVVRAKEEAPLLGLRWNQTERRHDLVHVDPVSLRALPQPAIAVGSWGVNWAYAPDRRRLAIAVHKESRRGIAASLQIVDPQTFRRELALPLGYSALRALTWPEPDRVVVARVAYHPERLEIGVVAPTAKRVIARSVLDGEVTAVGQASGALVLLLAPKGRIGAGTLVVASANGDVRSVTLDRIWIGFERDASRQDDYVATQRRAGLAVDAAGNRALVFPAGSDAAEVDLSTLAVTYHSLREPVSLFGRLRNFLEPTAKAKTVEGPWRTARWLGDGLVAVTGSDWATWKDRESRLQTGSTPAGLTLVDTKTWRARTIDRRATSVELADGFLLATGQACNSETRVCSAMGLAAYGLDGARRYRVFEERAVFVGQVFRGLAHVGENGKPLSLVELATGRVVATRPDAPPWLLLDDALFDG